MQTWQENFPYRSSREIQYIMVMYDYDANTIDVEPVQSWVAEDLKNLFVKLTEKLITRSCKPSTFILDNEI